MKKHSASFIFCTGIALFMVFLLVSDVHAEGNEFVAEGTYIMSSKDSPEKAKDIALFVAKKKALEQASVYMASASREKLLILSEEQLKALTNKVMNIDILEEKKVFVGEDIVFGAKIKANIDMNAIEEAIKTVQLEFPEKKKVGVILCVNMQPPTKNDLEIIYEWNYTLASYIQDYRVTEILRSAISEKYSSRNIVLDIGDSINNDFFSYLKEINVQVVNNNISKIQQEQIENYAKRNQYDYLLIVSPNFTNIEKVSEYLFFGWCFRVKLDMDCDIKIYDTTATKIIYSNKLSEKAKAESSAILVNSTMWPQTLTMATNKMLNKIKERLNKELPNIPNN